MVMKHEQDKSTIQKSVISEAKKKTAKYTNLIDEYRDRLDIPIPDDNDLRFEIYGVDPMNITEAQMEEVRCCARYIRELKQKGK
jgi:hypothetical protein